MEVDVPRSAEALLSNELAKLASEVTRFQQLFAGRVITAGTAPIHLCRFAQELAIYSRGAVVEKLCKNILVSQEDPSDKFDVRREQDGIALLSARILVHLASSRVVGSFCVRDERTAWALLDHFVESVECLREPNREKAVWRKEHRVFDEIEIDMWIAFFSTAGIVYFSRSSKLFRGSMRECPGLLPALEFCLSDGILSKCSEAHNASMRLRIANIIEALSFSADSQEWMIEQGFLKLTARVYETSHLESRQDAGHVCSMSLFRLSETLENVKLMKQKDLYSMLKPHIKQIEGHYGIWPLLQDRLLGRAKVPPKKLCKEPGENWRRILVDMYASGLPTVCSWRGCLEPEENVSGKRFSKCSRCHVAHYCSKEHQTLHWPLHKKHCLPPKRP